MRVDTGALKEQVGDQWLEMYADLAPQLDEAIDNLDRHVECPVHGGTDGFRLFDDAADSGGGVCNTCGAFADGIALLQWVNEWSFLETVQAIQQWLGDDPFGEEPLGGGRGEDFFGPEPPRRRDAPERRLLGPADGTEPSDNLGDFWTENDDACNHDQKAIANIERIIDAADPEHERIVAYYRHRGLSVAPPETVGYIDGERYYYDNGKYTSLPTMVAVVQAPDDTPVAIFRSYLDPDGDGKALVDTPKKLTKAIYPGATKGAAIRLRDPADGLIGLAEGLETSESVFQATGMPCWAAVSEGGVRRFVPPQGVTAVVIWADNDSTGVGQAAANTLANRLYRAGMPVSIVVPPRADTDWLDVLVDDVHVDSGEDAICHALDASPLQDPSAPGASPADELFPVPKKTTKRNSGSNKGQIEPDTAVRGLFARVVAELNERHFIVQVGGKTHVATVSRDPVTGHPDLRLGNVADFKILHLPWMVPFGEDQMIPAADLWLRSPERRQYEGITFSPAGDDPGWHNLWQGFSVEAVPGDCSLFWQHTFFVICRGNRQHYRYLRKWLAHMVQRPGELPGVAIVVLSKQGSGKGTFTDLVGKLLGPHALVLTGMDQLVGRFSGHLKDKLLVVANEATWGGTKAGEGALKAMVTDPVVPVEQKFVDLYNVRNFKRVVVTTNKAWAVPMEADDRRFLVLEASDERKGDRAYFDALYDQMLNRGGLQALLHALLREDLTGFDVRTKPASTHAFDIKLRSADPVVRWWYERLHVGVLRAGLDDLAEEPEWYQEPARGALHQDFLDFCRDHGARTLDEPTFGKELRKLLPGLRVGTTRPRTVAADGTETRPHRYVLPTLGECRQAFEAYMVAGPEIWD